MTITDKNSKLVCCLNCSSSFKKKNSEIKRSPNHYCSLECRYQKQITKQKVTCKECGHSFLKRKSDVEKTTNDFCSHSCNATYHNKNRTYGMRVSKLEVWISEQLTSLYPNLEVQYNRRDTIKSELDIYIPSLELAFEINGIFHYEPIFGESTLKQIQKNDSKKSKKCKDLGITLYHIDTTSQKNFSPESSYKFLDTIIQKINERRGLRSPESE